MLDRTVFMLKPLEVCSLGSWMAHTEPQTDNSLRLAPVLNLQMYWQSCVGALNQKSIKSPLQRCTIFWQLKIHFSFLCHTTYDTWLITYQMWHSACDMRNVACNMRQAILWNTQTCQSFICLVFMYSLEFINGLVTFVPYN